MSPRLKSSFLTYLIPWKTCFYSSIVLIPVLIVFNFYGLYSNQFYFLKVDNFIFPLVTILHFVYLYVVGFKIRESEYPDVPMRNVEYGMYAVLAIYIFKCLDTLYILSSFRDFQAHIIPETFLPLGILIFALQVFLVLLTLTAFRHRREQVGVYDFDHINENIDSWP
ncbi:hypothetical protein OZ410_11560 [Robiginitalea sp. M366]|uniref:hypothetical protein n=1 Tax=Robiginitalea aestuariiviva TaxID=3036903 RepID=UPI00240D9399|nr:hypothetical protein [Robiginitalea aestuariiviva]MDG1572955.1 hypothetical protein [Robiginitalea aestuariiviva]